MFGNISVTPFIFDKKKLFLCQKENKYDKKNTDSSNDRSKRGDR